MKLCNIHMKNLIILSVSGVFKGFKNWQKVAEICYQLVHDRASRGLALFLIWRHRLIYMATCMQNSFWRQIKNRPMPLTSSVMKQSISNFRLYCCSKKNQMLRKKVKLLLEQLQVCIFQKIVFGVRCTLNGLFQNFFSRERSFVFQDIWNWNCPFVPRSSAIRPCFCKYMIQSIRAVSRLLSNPNFMAKRSEKNVA